MVTNKYGITRNAGGLPALSWVRLAFAFLILSLILALPSGRGLAQGVRPGEEEHEGVLEVLHEDRDVGSRYVHFLRTATERLELRFASDPPALATGDRIRARGLRTNGVLALTSSSSTTTLSSGLQNTFGAQKTLVILVNFQDSTTQPYAVADAQGVMATTSGFDLENSFQQTWLDADVVGWYTIAQNSAAACNNYYTTADLAEQAATAGGVIVSAYSRRVYAFPSAGCTWWGLGTVGGNPSRAWVHGNFQQRVVEHEMGHNFGLYHSKSLSCDSSGCKDSEYGDRWDVMGSANPGHYNAFQKERLGWLDYNLSPPITSVTADGVYSIFPYEAPTSDPKALKVLKSSDSTGSTYYYLEYRAKLGYDSGLLNGVIVHTGKDTNANSSYLWDLDQVTTTPDYILSVGQSYTDAVAGVTMALLSMDSAAASVSVTFGSGGSSGGSTPSGGSTTCARANPTVAISPSGTQSVQAGSSLTYTVSVTNNDNSACSSSTFSLGASVPTGWAASLGSASLSIAAGGSSSTTLLVTTATTAASGSYSVGVTATNGGSSTYSGSASVTVSVQSVCVLANPTVTISPSTQWVIGTTGNYTVTITDNDSSACAPSSYNLSASVPSGLLAALAPLAALSPGTSTSASLQLAASSTTPDGFYNFTVTATNSTNSSYSGSASGVEVCCSGTLAVKVTTDKSIYPQNSWANITVNVRVGQTPVSGASVSVNIVKGGSTLATLTGATDTNGNLFLRYRIGPNAPTGTYQAAATVKANGYFGSNNTATFMVVPK